MPPGSALCVPLLSPSAVPVLWCYMCITMEQCSCVTARQYRRTEAGRMTGRKQEEKWEKLENVTAGERQNFLAHTLKMLTDSGRYHPVFTILHHTVLMWVVLPLCLPHVEAPASCSSPCRWLAQKVPSSEVWIGVLCFIEPRGSNLLSPIICPFPILTCPCWFISLLPGQVLCTTALEVFFFQNIKDFSLETLVTEILLLPWLWHRTDAQLKLFGR